MLKMLIIGGLLLPALALAEPVKVAKPVVCDDLNTMISYLNEKYDEKPFWMGNVSSTEKFVLMINEETQSWSAIQFDPSQEISCLIEAGTGFKFKLPTGSGV